MALETHVELEFNWFSFIFLFCSCLSIDLAFWILKLYVQEESPNIRNCRGLQLFLKHSINVNLFIKYSLLLTLANRYFLIKSIDPSEPQDELVESLSPLKILISTVNICGCVYFSEENVPALVRLS